MEELQDVYRLLAFVTVVQEGSLAAAVKKLHITQPALSARLRLLEESFGCPLLERTTRGVKPTNIGKLMYELAQDIIKQMEILQTTILSHIELRKGCIHVGGGSSSVIRILPDAISEFNKKYPKIQFTIIKKNSHLVIEALNEGSIDIGFIAKEPFMSSDENQLQGLKIHLEIPTPYAIIASPENKISKMANSLKAKNKCLLPIHLAEQQMGA